MYTLQRLVSNSLIKNCVINSLHYSTKPKRIVYRKKRTYADPGINQRKQLLGNTPIDELEDIDLDELESDFMSVHKTHKEYEQELEARKEQERYFMIKQKYFKEKLPNFLTMNDKLQIKYLHNSDPEQWTVEKLAESFPALPHIISVSIFYVIGAIYTNLVSYCFQKILKSNWRKKNVDRIKSHDQTVSENWEKFKSGQLKDLPSDLVEHLKKFTRRTVNTESYDPSLYESITNETSVAKPKLKKTEFSDIITSYEKITSKQNEKETSEDVKLLETSEPIQSLEKKSRSRITLPQLKKEIETAVKEGKPVTETELLILQEVQTGDSRNKIVELKEDIFAIQQRVEKPSQVAKSKSKKDYSFLDYPLKIKIPAKVYKPGYTYKLNDCYYDEQGVFLYRVPGMSA